MPTLANRPEFQPNAGFIGDPNRGMSPAPPPGFQAPLSQAVAQNFPTQRQAPLAQQVAQNTGGRGGHEFCPT
ncbi:hypothetical protein LCGC14_2421690, partial [marine sediment metagenome]